MKAKRQALAILLAAMLIIGNPSPTALADDENPDQQTEQADPALLPQTEEPEESAEPIVEPETEEPTEEPIEEPETGELTEEPEEIDPTEEPTEEPEPEEAQEPESEEQAEEDEEEAEEETTSSRRRASAAATVASDPISYVNEYGETVTVTEYDTLYSTGNTFSHNVGFFEGTYIPLIEFPTPYTLIVGNNFRIGNATLTGDIKIYPKSGEKVTLTIGTLRGTGDVSAISSSGSTIAVNNTFNSSYSGTIYYNDGTTISSSNDNEKLDPTYTVTIPATVTMAIVGDEAYLAGTVSITASDVAYLDGKTLQVTASNVTGLKNSDSDYSVDVTLDKDVCSFAKSTREESQEISLTAPMPGVAGNYSGSITFSVSLVDSGS